MEIDWPYWMYVIDGMLDLFSALTPYLLLAFSTDVRDQMRICVMGKKAKVAPQQPAMKRVVEKF